MPTTTAQRPANDRTARRTAASRRHAKAMRPTPPKQAGDEWLTVDEFCAELKIGKRTYERWRSQGIAPRADRPTRNGPLRMRRSWVDEWVASRA
jgi:Helix-turn-helix domain